MILQSLILTYSKWKAHRDLECHRLGSIGCGTTLGCKRYDVRCLRVHAVLFCISWDFTETWPRPRGEEGGNYVSGGRRIYLPSLR